MSTVAIAAPPGTAAAQALALARRAIVGITRQPQVVLTSLTFPLVFTSINSAAFERSTNLPGFPEVGSFLAFLLPAAVMQGAIFGSLSAGNDVATDVATGFFDRLVATPVWRTSIVVGRLAGAGVLGAVQALWFTAVFVPFGATMAGGLPSLGVLVATAALIAMAIGGFAMAMGLRTGSAEAVQGSFPLIFILLFTSSAFFPRELMTGWYRSVAGVNPISHLVESLRELTTQGFGIEAALTAVGVAVGVGVVSVSLALLALRARVEAR